MKAKLSGTFFDASLGLQGPEKSRSECPHYHKGIFFINVRGKEGNPTNPRKFLPVNFVKDNHIII